MFAPGYAATIPSTPEEDSKMYQKLKYNKNLSKYKVKGLAYYVINSAWIKNWRLWVEKGISPGPINNKMIAETIMTYRMN